MSRKKIIIISIASVLVLLLLGLGAFFVIENSIEKEKVVDLDSIYISDENNTPQLESDQQEVLDIDEDINVDKVGKIDTDENRKIVSFDNELSDEEKNSLEEEYNITFTDDEPVNGTYTIITDESSKVEELEEDNSVNSVETDVPVKMFADTVDWGILRIGASNVWESGTGSGVKVAVIDTGIQLNHPDLSGNILTGYDFVNNDSSANDDNGHGTHVAGIVASTMNGSGNVGASYSAKLIPIKVLNESGYGYLSDVAKGIYYATDNGARVINLSLGTPYDSDVMRRAVTYASNKGVLIVAAAGNESGAPCSYPAAYSSVVCVVATTQDNKLASFSNIGGELAAPGVSNYSTYINSSYAKLSGTSMASPHVAGSAALLMSVCTDCTTSQIRDILRSTAIDLGAEGKDIIFGYGLVNLVDAINEITGEEGEIPNDEETPTPISENISDYQEANQGTEDQIQNEHKTEETRLQISIVSPIKNSGNRYVAKTNDDVILKFEVTPTDDTVKEYKIYINNEEIVDYDGMSTTYNIDIETLKNNQYSVMVEAILDNDQRINDTLVIDLTRIHKIGGSVKGISDVRYWFLDLFFN